MHLINFFTLQLLFSVVDAWGKTPSGVLSGNIADLGNYDQCLRIRHELETDNIFQGQYCFSLVRTADSTASPINTRMLPGGAPTE